MEELMRKKKNVDFSVYENGALNSYLIQTVDAFTRLFRRLGGGGGEARAAAEEDGDDRAGEQARGEQPRGGQVPGRQPEVGRARGPGRGLQVPHVREAGGEAVLGPIRHHGEAQAAAGGGGCVGSLGGA